MANRIPASIFSQNMFDMGCTCDECNGSPNPEFGHCPECRGVIRLVETCPYCGYCGKRDEKSDMLH